MNYNPSFLNSGTSLSRFYADQGAPTTTFGQYVNYTYAGPTNLQSLTTSTMDCDVTTRNLASVRLAAGEGAQTGATLLTQVAGLIGQPMLPGPNNMDNQILNSSGMTMQAAWTPW